MVPGPCGAHPCEVMEVKSNLLKEERQQLLTCGMLGASRPHRHKDHYNIAQCITVYLYVYTYIYIYIEYILEYSMVQSVRV